MRATLVRWAVAASLAVAVALAVPGPLDGEAEARRRRRPRPLRIVSIKPRHGKTFVDLASVCVVRFNRPVSETTVAASTVTFRRVRGADVEHRVSFDRGGKRLVLTPFAPLDPGADYEVVVRRGVATADGSTIRNDRRVAFFTDPRFSSLPFLRPEQFEDLPTPMVEGRAFHTSSLLPDGRVLVAGGSADAINFAVSGEVFDGSIGNFRAVQTPLRNPRAGHAAVQVWNSVLLVGGYFMNSTGIRAVDACDVYSRTTNTFEVGPTLVEGRDYPAACALPDGRVFVTGGLEYDDQGFAKYSVTAEIIDHDGLARLAKGKPILRRAGHTATLLPNGTVLVVGGIASNANFAPSAEIFDPVTETFRPTLFSPANHRSLHTATALPDAGVVALADGGNPILEVFDPSTERFLTGGGASFVNRSLATASLVGPDWILFTGGLEQRGDETLILQSMDLFVRSAGDQGRVFRVGTVLSVPRAAHTATTLVDGRVLISGGLSADPAFPNVETAVIFTPQEDE